MQIPVDATAGVTTITRLYVVNSTENKSCNLCIIKVGKISFISWSAHIPRCPCYSILLCLIVFEMCFIVFEMCFIVFEMCFIVFETDFNLNISIFLEPALTSMLSALCTTIKGAQRGYLILCSYKTSSLYGEPPPYTETLIFGNVSNGLFLTPCLGKKVAGFLPCFFGISESVRKSWAF